MNRHLNFNRGAAFARFAIVAAVLTCWSINTHAQAIEEILVTATKRAESIQDVPISITAFSANDLKESGVTNLRELQAYAPNFYVASSSQVANTRVVIRGVSSAGDNAIEPSVAVFIDGVYYPRAGSIIGRLQDIESVEVLRGPQGTVFGRNASAGALNIRTKAPSDEPEFDIFVTAGNFDSRSADVSISGGITDKIAGRLALQYADRDGYGFNLFDGQNIGFFEDNGARGSLSFTPNDRFTATFRADYKRVENGAPVVELLPDSVLPEFLDILAFAQDPDLTDNGGVPNGPLPDVSDPFDFTVNQVHNDSADDSQWGISADLEWELDNHIIRSVTSYRDWQNDTFESSIRLPTDLIDRVTAFTTETFSQEFQFLSSSDGPLQYVVGGYFYLEDYTFDQFLGLAPDFCDPGVVNVAISMGVPPAFASGVGSICDAGGQSDAVFSEFEQEIVSLAAFAQATYDFTEKFGLTVGARLTNDDKEGSFVANINNIVAGPSLESDPVNGNALGLDLRVPEVDEDLNFNETQVTWLVTGNYRPTENTLLFATIATGYKGGGFNSESTAVNLTDLGQRVFDSETVINYELGVKTTVADQATINFTLYRTVIDDFQDRVFDGLGFTIINAGELRQQGAELDARWFATENFTVSTGVSYLDSEFLSYPEASNLPGFLEISPTQDLSGFVNSFSPEFQASLVLDYRDQLAQTNVQWFARGEHNFIGAQNATAANDGNPETIQSGYGLTNARFGFAQLEGKWEVAVYGRNITDEGFCQNGFYQPLNTTFNLVDTTTGNSASRCVLGEPRTFGVEFRYSL